MYSHYFKITEKPDVFLWNQLMTHVAVLFKNLPNHAELERLGVIDVEGDIILRGPMGDKKPICNAQRIAFNGDAATKMDYESFTLLPKKMSESCKTARRPYDFVVCAVLILAHTILLDGIHITSDGDAEDWYPALNYLRESIWFSATLPPLRQRSTLESESVSKSPKEKPFSVDLKNIESVIGDFYF